MLPLSGTKLRRTARAAVPGRDGRRPRRAAAGCSPSPGSAPTSPRPGPPPTPAIADVRFDGMQVRRDIGWRAPGAALTSYAAAGVDIDEGNRAVAGMKAAVERTHGAEVVRGVGSFGGVFSAKAIAAMDDPGARRLDRRRRHQGRAGRPARPGPRRRHGHRQPLHRRRARAGGPAAVLPRLHRRRRARRRPRRRGRHRDGRGVRGRRVHAARRRDGGDARRLRAGRVRHRRHARRRRRASRRCSPAPTSPPATC